MYQYFECTNPDCHLRFPAPVGQMDCPRCKAACIAILAVSSNQLDTHIAPPPHRFSVLLDNIRSTFNVGAMFRTADGAGLERIYLTGTSPTPDHPKIGKTALGAEYSIPWEYHANGLELARQFHKQGYHIWALEVDQGAELLYRALPLPVDAPIVLVVGNEVAGIDPDIIRLCERTLWLPMQGFKRSLNVAIAFGIAVYTLQFGGCN